MRRFVDEDIVVNNVIKKVHKVVYFDYADQRNALEVLAFIVILVDSDTLLADGVLIKVPAGGEFKEVIYG